MEDTLVFVDDGFFKLVKKFFSEKTGKSKKYLQCFRNICKNENLNLKHLYIYTAPPFQSSKPTEREISLMSKYQIFTNMLRKKTWVTVREGRCQKRIDARGIEKFSQKGVDALLIIDMFEVKEKHPEIKKIILIACDSDFVPIIEKMKSNGFEIILYTYFGRERDSRFSTSNHILKTASRWEKMSEKIFEDR